MYVPSPFAQRMSNTQSAAEHKCKSDATSDAKTAKLAADKEKERRRIKGRDQRATETKAASLLAVLVQRPYMHQVLCPRWRGL